MLSIRRKIRTSRNIYTVGLSTYLYESENDVALNILTLFADKWETFAMGYKAITFGVVVLNRAFDITLSRTER